MDGCVEQVLHQLVVVLPVVLVLVGCKVPEDMELLECCVQEEPVNLSRVILGVPQVRSKTPDFVDLLENHPENIYLPGGWPRTGVKYEGRRRDNTRSNCCVKGTGF